MSRQQPWLTMHTSPLNFLCRRGNEIGGLRANLPVDGLETGINDQVAHETSQASIHLVVALCGLLADRSEPACAPGPQITPTCPCDNGRMLRRLRNLRLRPGTPRLPHLLLLEEKAAGEEDGRPAHCRISRPRARLLSQTDAVWSGCRSRGTGCRLFGRTPLHPLRRVW